eukprot:379448-Amphidinium_carterae.1
MLGPMEGGGFQLPRVCRAILTVRLCLAMRFMSSSCVNRYATRLLRGIPTNILTTTQQTDAARVV